ncbi:MAG: NAD(P)H-dependent oxidoreductase subunit E [Acidobacteriota bacterium]
MQELRPPATCHCNENDLISLNQVLAETRDCYAGQPGALIPLLQSVQNRVGYLPEEALIEIARIIRVPTATVFGVATFYTQFHLQPQGCNTIRICTGTACHVRGSNQILKDVKRHLHIEPNATTPDRMFTIRTVACFGACALAPVVVVNESVNGRMNPSKTIGMLENLANARFK